MKPDAQTLRLELPLPTPDGVFVAQYSPTGLAGLLFPTGKTPPPPAAVSAPIRRWHALTQSALLQGLAGRAPKRLPPLDLARGTEFQRAVWTALGRIAPGQTRSYREVAQVIGRPQATRAVGGACGANPIPVLVPCHRVLASDGRLGGFTAGLAWKRKLLAVEGVRVA